MVCTEGSVIQFLHLGAEKNHVSLNNYNRSGRYSKYQRPKYKSEPLPHKPNGWIIGDNVLSNNYTAH